MHNRLSLLPRRDSGTYYPRADIYQLFAVGGIQASVIVHCERCVAFFELDMRTVRKSSSAYRGGRGRYAYAADIRAAKRVSADGSYRRRNSYIFNRVS